MADATQPAPVKLVVALLVAAPAYLESTLNRLEERFGPVDAASAVGTVHSRDATMASMAAPLLRQCLSFDRLIGPGKLAGIKQLTTSLELELAVGGQPRIKLSPGYITELKLILASGSDASHRIYLSGGTYAEAALTFSSGAFRPQPFTSPDWQEPAVLAFITTVRATYLAQLRAHVGH